jgi:hypothetical protein
MNSSYRRLAVAAAAAAVLSCLPVLAETRIEKNLKLDPGGKLTVDSTPAASRITGSASRCARRLTRTRTISNPAST